MKRTLAVAITALMAGTSIWLASSPADARPKPAKSPVHQSATIKALTRWTYQGDGKLAVTANCPQRRDLAVVRSKMLPHPVNMRHGGYLLINVTDKTKPGKYAIALSCAPKGGRVNGADVISVKIMKRLSPFKQPRTPALPRHFHASVTVRSGPPAARTTAPGKSEHCGCMHGRKHHPKKAPVPATPVPPLSPNPYLPQAS